MFYDTKATKKSALKQRRRVCGCTICAGVGMPPSLFFVLYRDDHVAQCTAYMCVLCTLVAEIQYLSNSHIPAPKAVSSQ